MSYTPNQNEFTKTEIDKRIRVLRFFRELDLALSLLYDPVDRITVMIRKITMSVDGLESILNNDIH